MIKCKRIKFGTRLIFFTLILVFPLDHTWSQTAQFGFGIGVNRVQSEFVSLPHYWHPQDKRTFSATLHASLSLNDHLGFQSGLRFVQYAVGVQYDYTPIGDDLSDNTPGTFSFTQYYLTAPLHFTFTVASKPRLYLLAGPELGYLVEARLGTGLSSTGITENLNRFNLILNAGLGSQFNFSTLKFFIQGLYFFSMTDALKPDLPGLRYFPTRFRLLSNWRSSGLRVSVGYIF